MPQKNQMTMEIDGITYIVSTHYSKGEETIIEKITRLHSDSGQCGQQHQ